MSSRRRVATALAVAFVVLGTVVPDRAVGAIVGGVETTRESHPYFVKLRQPYLNGPVVCGGTLIDPNWVLTAAHCVDDFTRTTPIVDLRDGPVARPEDEARVTEIRLHPLWDGETTNGHDLALLRLPESASAGIPTIQAGAPFDGGAYAAGNFAALVGVGRTDPDERPDGTVRMVTMRIRSDNYMEGLYDPWYHFGRDDDFKASLHIGAGSRTKTACNGDSGGPLYANRSRARVQIGVASYVRRDCDRPAIYSELRGAQLAWLATQVPSIVERWGACTAGNRTGTPRASYGTSTSDGSLRDGRYRWSIRCHVEMTPPPNPDPPDVEPPICLINPHKCEIQL